MALVLPSTPKSPILHAIKRRTRQLQYQREKLPIYIFTHHKTGTVLATNVLKEVSDLLGLKFCRVYGYCDETPSGFDVVVFEHSLVSDKILSSDFKGIHIVRDPRDVLVSGYQYHRRTKELWCNTNPVTIGLTDDIKFPFVPYSCEHKSLQWKKKYLEGLNGLSYKDNLLRLDIKEGLAFELERYASWTIEDMASWNYRLHHILEVKMEDILKSYDSVFTQIFEHLGFGSKLRKRALEIAMSHDLNRMSESEIQANKHIQSTNPSKWKNMLDDEALRIFNEKYGESLEKIGYF